MPASPHYYPIFSGVSFLDMFRLAREGLDYTFEPKESPLLGPIYQIFSDFDYEQKNLILF